MDLFLSPSPPRSCMQYCRYQPSVPHTVVKSASSPGWIDCHMALVICRWVILHLPTPAPRPYPTAILRTRSANVRQYIGVVRRIFCISTVKYSASEEVVYSARDTRYCTVPDNVHLSPAPHTFHPTSPHPSVLRDFSETLRAILRISLFSHW